MTGAARAAWDRARSLLPGRRDYAGLGRSWRSDLLAGATVGIVALPLALAFGVSSGAGAESGLITAIIAGIVAAFFGGSNVQVSGPTGAMVVVLAPIIATHGIGALGVVCVMAGGIVALAGILRLGRVVALIPWPVIEGFTLGIAIIIFLQQVPTALGVTHAGSGNALVVAVHSLFRAHWPVVAWTIGTVVLTAAIMVLTSRFLRRVPGSIVAIVLVTLVTLLLHAPVISIGALPVGLPGPRIPSAGLDTVVALVGPAFAVAALAAIESLLSARVAASLSARGSFDPDRELLGQGLASVASGLFGGMPATGAIARTAVNARSGAQTRVAAMVHSLVLIVVVSAASTVVSVIPVGALAAVLMVTAVRMMPVSTIRSVLKSSGSDAIVFVVTALVTVSVDLIVAVGIGILAAGFFALRSLARTSGVERESLPGAAEAGDEGIALFRLDGALFFATAEQTLRQIADVTGVSVVILRLSQLQLVDATGARVVAELVRALEGRGITVIIKGIRPAHLALSERAGIVSALRHRNHLFDDLDAAVAHARSHSGGVPLMPPQGSAGS